MAVMQVDQVLDSNMKDGLVDEEPAVTESVNMPPVSGSETTRAPIILDSSQVAVVEARLHCQDKAIVAQSTLNQARALPGVTHDTPPQLPHVLCIVSSSVL